METEFPYRLVFVFVLLAVVVFLVSRLFQRTPWYPRMEDGYAEPFFGGAARGTGQPDCLRTLPETSQLLAMFPKQHAALTDDYRELQLLLSKMACLKQDLMSPNGIPEATRYQAFETAHDRMPVAEVVGMCMSQNLAARDLEIVFLTWRDRAKTLMSHVATAEGLRESDMIIVEQLFSKAWEDVYQISKGKCLRSENDVVAKGQIDGGDAAPAEPVSLAQRRAYEHTYPGMSASGWNGAVA